MGTDDPLLSALVLESKTSAPKFNTSFVHRADLIHSARTGSSRLVTVTAAAGYGKTSLLAEWAQSETRPTGWLTLRAEDDDPSTLVRLLAHACAGFASESRAVIDLLASAQDAVLGRLAPALALVLERQDVPFVLFVDDLHVLQDPDCIDVLDVVFSRIPEGSQVVLASRHRLTQLARNRLASSAAEIDAGDLRIDAHGAEQLAAEAGVQVSESVLDQWVELCDGWAAGIHMCALLSAKEPFRPPAESPVLADYLYQEFIRDLPEDTRTFLMRSSILSTHIPDLCNAVLERTDSAHVLRDLEARQLFVTADPTRRAYRLHPLFREYLQAALQLEEGSSVPGLHARAAAWFAERGELPAAIDHALAAADFRLATNLVTAAGLQAYEAGQSATLGRWFRAIGDANLLENASAVIVITWFAVLAGDDDDARKWATLLERVPDDADAGGMNVASAKAMIRAIMMPGGVDTALADAQFAVATEPLESPWRDPALQILGSTLLHSGDTERGFAVLTEAIDVARARNNPASVAIAESEFAFVSIEDGAWGVAEEHVQRALDAIDAGGIDGYVMAPYAQAAAACVQLQAGRSVSGRRHLAQAMSERHRSGTAVPLLSIPTRLLIARAHLLIADTDSATVLLDEIDELFPVPAVGAALRARIADVREQARAQKALRAAPHPSIALTAAEQRLIPYLQTHLTRDEIAQRLHVSVNTVNTQLSAVFRKIGATTRSEAVDRAHHLELIGAISS
jgi:LuxR family maltose regulon positive regulatory protein